MKSFNLSHLKSLINRFGQAKILVVGDLILDDYIWGDVSRISPEAPVPVVWVQSENHMPGGASNVANNIHALGGRVFLAGVIGTDSRGEVLLDLLRAKGMGVRGVVTDKTRQTTLKTRVIAQHQQVVRIDRENINPIGDPIINKVINYIREVINTVDAVVIEDYGKGVIVPRLVSEIVRMAKRHKKIITVDPKEEHFSYYEGVSAVTPNHHEAGRAVNMAIKDDASLEKAGQLLLNKLRCDNVLITLGEKGVSLFQKGKKTIRIPTVAQDVFDVSGAGDTVISVFTLCLALGSTPEEAAHVSNCAAGIVVGKVGVAVTTQDELIERIKHEISKH